MLSILPIRFQHNIIPFRGILCHLVLLPVGSIHRVTLLWKVNQCPSVLLLSWIGILRLMTLSHIMPFLQSINVPSSSPNSGPGNVQIFYLQSAVRYAFCISQTSISSSFNAAIVKAILTESLDTTNKNVNEEVADVVFPPTTSHAFLLKLSPSLISNIIWHLICWYPGGRSSVLPSYASNAGHTFFIFCSMASHHNVSPFYLSISMISLTVL